jgi:hypothetical protein
VLASPRENTNKDNKNFHFVRKKLCNYPLAQKKNLKIMEYKNLIRMNLLKKKFDYLSDDTYAINDFIQTQLKFYSASISIFYRTKNLCYIGTFMNNECIHNYAILEIGKEFIYFTTDNLENKIICSNYYQIDTIPKDVEEIYKKSKNKIKKMVFKS